MAYKSIYKPKNPEKYNGNINNIVCRSSWERKVCIYLDENNNVIQWGSEELYIPYFSPIDNKWHKYYPDFLAKIKDNSNNIKKYILEVKPHKQTIQPKERKNKRTYLNEMKTFTINTCKWEATEKFCDEHGWIFKLLTEKDIFR